MTPQGLIDECRLSGVLVHLDGGKLKLKGSPDAVRIAANRLRPFKTEIVRYQMNLMAAPVSGLVREFMEADGLALDEAKAMTAISVQPRPAAQWLVLIAELDALIERYCLAAGLTGESRSAIVSVRFNQSLASIPESLDWFRREVGRLDVANAPPAPPPPKERNFEGRASAKAARAALHQPITKEPKP